MRSGSFKGGASVPEAVAVLEDSPISQNPHLVRSWRTTSRELAWGTTPLIDTSRLSKGCLDHNGASPSVTLDILIYQPIRMLQARPDDPWRKEVRSRGPDEV